MMDDRKSRKAYFILAGVAVFLGLVASFYGFLDHVGIDITPQTVSAFLERARGTPWALPLICVIYIFSGFILFPVTILNLACAMVFGAARGVAYGLIGSLLNATVFFWLGRLAGRRNMRGLLDKPKIRRLDDKLRNAGVVGVAMIRLAPIAPSSLVNLAAGVTSISFIDYFFGSLLALIPGAIGRGIVGDSLMQLFLNPEPKTYAYLGFGVLLWLVIMVLLHQVTRRWRKTHPDMAPVLDDN